MFYDSAMGLVRVVVIGLLAYAALIAVLRISGKRTLAKMNAFDLVVTVALGSTLATIVLSKDVALAEGVLALVVLVGLQFVLAWSALRFGWVETVAKSRPQALLVDGRIDPAALKRERVTREEVMAAIRGSGHGDPSRMAAVVLETDGSFSVIARDQAGDRTALPSA